MGFWHRCVMSVRWIWATPPTKEQRRRGFENYALGHYLGESRGVGVNAPKVAKGEPRLEGEKIIRCEDETPNEENGPGKASEGSNEDGNANVKK